MIYDPKESHSIEAAVTSELVENLVKGNLT
jgi:hypothetical protein